MPAISTAITIRASEWTNPPPWHGCWHGSTACRAGKGFSSHTCPLQAITPMPLRSTVPSRFFFSCRRRHTRSLRDWSSDVCSSDLEGDNLAIFGLTGSGQHVITSTIEHHAVLNSCKHLEASGVEVSFVPVNGRGLVDPADVRRRSEEHTSELQSRRDLVCRLLLEKKKKRHNYKPFVSYTQTYRIDSSSGKHHI